MQDRRGQGEPPAPRWGREGVWMPGQPSQLHPQQLPAQIWLHSVHPVQDRPRSPQHPPFPGSTQAAGLCRTDSTQEHPAWRRGTPPGEEGGWSCGPSAVQASSHPCPLSCAPRGSLGNPSTLARLALGGLRRELGEVGGCGEGGRDHKGGRANCWSLGNAAAPGSLQARGGSPGDLSGLWAAVFCPCSGGDHCSSRGAKPPPRTISCL